jgi:hypothetical protein|tara:strand:+ start:12 stop:233 length:222 start_codon:yes stop_codon:yes gene_type:complete
MEQVSLQNLAQPQIVSTNNMIPQDVNISSSSVSGSSIFLGISLIFLIFGLPLILYLIYNSVNSKASKEASKLK